MPLRVLAVEDDALILMNTVDMLEDFGCVVGEAVRGSEALSILAADAYDVLLTDVGLPDMTGVELARRARLDAPEIVVIFATGRMHVEGAEAIPGAIVLHKPFSMGDLQKLLKDIRK